MRERTGTFAGTRFGVNPVAGEKRFCLRGHLRIKSVKGRKHQLTRLVPAEFAIIIAGKWGIPVPPVQRVAAHPASFQPVIAVRQISVAIIHRGDQRINRLVIYIIIKIARCHRPRKSAPAILHLLVLGDGVQHQ